MKCFKIVVLVVLCVSSIVSCFCWAKSSMAKVPAKIPGSIIVWTDESGFEMDIAATAKKQTKWNQIAAGFASIAAVAQAVLALLPE